MIPLAPREPRKRVETDTLKEILSALARIPGVRAARNNVGTLRDETGRPVTYGLGNGSPDIVGVMTFGGVNSTLVGLREAPMLAIAFGIEVKMPGKVAARNQRAWHTVARKRGLRTKTVTSEGEAVDFVRSLRGELAEAIRQIARVLG